MTPGTRRLSIVIPAYNEAPGIERAVYEIHAGAHATGLPFSIILVDDGSTDGTWQRLTSLATERPEVIALRLSRRFGKEAAIAAGLDVATGDAVILLDADLQHPPQLIPTMVRLWLTGEWDVVDAVKRHRGREPWLRGVTARAFYRTAGVLTGYHLQDASDFKLIDRRVVEAWRRFGERATFFRGLVAWLGFRHTEVTFDVPERVGSGTRWSLGSLTTLAIHAVTSFSALPLQVITLFGGMTLVLALGLGLQALRQWLQGTAFPGFTTVILLQLIIGGFLMISLGIIGTYIARIYDEVKARPRYIVQETSGRAERTP